MEIIAEIEPTRSYEKLMMFMDFVGGYADWVDVPEAPLGKSRALSVVVATIVQKDFNMPTIAHVRVQDHNLIGLHNVLGATRLAGIKRVVLLRGDPRDDVSPCSSLSPEDALEVLKEENPNAEGGLLLSIRRDPKDIERRLKAGADFYLVLNVERPEDLPKYADRREVKDKFIPYVLVLTEKNKELLQKSLPRAPKFKLSKLEEVLDKFKDIVKGVLISVPGDLQGLRRALKIARGCK
jgi:5,10-methylenetetrahydrofolate reductase